MQLVSESAGTPTQFYKNPMPVVLGKREEEGKRRKEKGRERGREWGSEGGRKEGQRAGKGEQRLLG